MQQDLRNPVMKGRMIVVAAASGYLVICRAGREARGGKQAEYWLLDGRFGLLMACSESRSSENDARRKSRRAASVAPNTQNAKAGTYQGTATGRFKLQ